MKYSFGISDFLEEIPSLSHSVVFLYFFVSGFPQSPYLHVQQNKHHQEAALWPVLPLETGQEQEWSFLSDPQASW